MANFPPILITHIEEIIVPYSAFLNSTSSATPQTPPAKKASPKRKSQKSSPNPTSPSTSTPAPTFPPATSFAPPTKSKPYPLTLLPSSSLLLTPPTSPYSPKTSQPFSLPPSHKRPLKCWAAEMLIYMSKGDEVLFTRLADILSDFESVKSIFEVRKGLPYFNSHQQIIFHSKF